MSRVEGESNGDAEIGPARSDVELIDGDADVAFGRGVALLDAFAEIGDFVVDEFRERAPARERVFAGVIGADGLNRDEVAVVDLPRVDELADGPEFVAAGAESDGAFERFAEDRVGGAERRGADRGGVDLFCFGEPGVFAGLPTL